METQGFGAAILAAEDFQEGLRGYQEGEAEDSREEMPEVQDKIQIHSLAAVRTLACV